MQRRLLRPLLIAALCCLSLTWLAGPSGRLLVVLPLLLFAPGYLIERALRPLPQPQLGARPALWLGLSLSSVALLYEWITALGLALHPRALDMLALACALGLGGWLWVVRDTRHEAGDLPPESNPYLPSSNSHPGWALALLAVLVLTVATRVYQVRDLALPNWVDPVHHALLVRVAIERGQAPLDLRPYLPIEQIPYHWGYHVFVAALTQLARAPLPAAMLWSGQALNALHVVAAAGLAAQLWRRPMAGVTAGIVVGLIAIMPAYYVSWGRYTQLSGLLLLAPIVLAWLALLRAPTWRAAAALALLLAGLSLIHFIVLLFALLFMAVSGASWLITGERFTTKAPGHQEAENIQGVYVNRLMPAFLGALVPWWSRSSLHSLRIISASAATALALSGPWLWVLAQRRLAPGPGGGALALVGGGSFNALDANLLWAGHMRALVALALAAALWGVWRRAWPVADLLGWLVALVVCANPWLALYLLPAAGLALLLWALARRSFGWALLGVALLPANPWLLRLPYLALMTNEALVISLFIPLGVLTGGAAAALWERARQPAVRAACALGLAALALWGAWGIRDVVNPGTVLATAGDVAAIEWAAEHTPPDARFLINTAPWLGTGRGADGGFWLLPLAGRWTSAPPVLYDYGPPAYVAAVRARNRMVMSLQPGQEQQLYDLIAREGITYVYLGARPGALTLAAFPRAAGFEPVYERDGVTILAVVREARTENREPCEASGFLVLATRSEYGFNNLPPSLPAGGCLAGG